MNDDAVSAPELLETFSVVFLSVLLFLNFSTIWTSQNKQKCSLGNYDKKSE